MDVMLQFDRHRFVDEDGNFLNKYLGMWLHHHAYMLPLRMDAVPCVGETLLLHTESGEQLRFQVKERIFNASIYHVKFLNPVTIFVDVLDVESIKSSLLRRETIMLSASVQDYLREQFDSKATALFNVFRIMGISTYADLCQYTSEELMRIKGIGPSKMEYIESHLKSVGLSLGMDPSEYGVPACDKKL